MLWRQARCFREDGFTLVELVLAILILAIIFAILAPVLKTGFNSYFLRLDTVQADWQGRVALARATRELRDIRSPADLTIAPSTQITFVDTSGNTIQYSLSGDKLMRNTAELASGVSALSFSYLTSSHTATVTASDVHYIVVQFTEQQGQATATYRTTVNPRGFP